MIYTAKPALSLPCLALTIYQPWDWAFTSAGKRLENRPWRPQSQLSRGSYLCLHAAGVKSLDVDALEDFREMAEDDLGGIIEPVPAKDEIVTSAIVAVLRYWGSISAPPPPSSSQREWWAGPYGWIFDEVHVLRDPVGCRGYQKLWNVQDADRAEVVAGLANPERVWTSDEGWKTV